MQAIQGVSKSFQTHVCNSMWKTFTESFQDAYFCVDP